MGLHGGAGIDVGAECFEPVARIGIDPDPQPVLPPDVRVQPFRPGRDEDAWLRVNGRAFAAHPEQGSWTLDDVRLREAEPWFDPEGFLLAWRGDPDEGGVLLGSHWTKVHPAGNVADEPVGEVYVLAVDPNFHGERVGAALLARGVHHLVAAGVDVIELYVEENNPRALDLYAAAGFTEVGRDVLYLSTMPGAADPDRS